MSLLALPKTENAIDAVKALIKELNVPVSHGTIRSSLYNHPDYPSLLSISECLAEWQIPNTAYQLDKEEYNPTDLEFPLIAYFNNKSFVLIKGIKDGSVSYVNTKNRKAVMSESTFLQQWGGIFLHAEPTSKSGEEEFRAKRFKDVLNSLRISAVIAVLLGLISYVFFQQRISLTFTGLTILTMAGLAASILLLLHSVNAVNPFIQNLCSLGKKNNCNAILKSKEANLTGWLSWSEVGFFYFAGSLINLLLVPQAIYVLVILNLLTLPYTFWSIGYQYKTEKWCVLCCSIQGLLWLQFVFFAVGIGFSIPSLNMHAIILFLVSFLVPVVIWGFIKPFLLSAEQVRPLKQQLKKFKYNSDLFNQILTNQTRFSVPQEIMPIVLGNADALNTITMVSNPFCGPCGVMHKKLDQWLGTRNDIQLKIVFATANSDDDPKTKVSKHINALSKLGDKRKVELALNDWYEQSNKDYESWAKNYPVDMSGEMELVTQRQKEWCDLAEIKFTPTIMVNGYKLPDPYVLEDLKYLLN